MSIDSASWTFTAAAVVVLLATACGAPAGDSGTEIIESDAYLTDLVALPHLSWSDKETDSSKPGLTVLDTERA
jgi:hypothetical protein